MAVAAAAMTVMPAIVAVAAATSSSTSDSSSLETQVSFRRVEGQLLLSIMNGDGERERVCVRERVRHTIRIMTRHNYN